MKCSVAKLTLLAVLLLLPTLSVAQQKKILFDAAHGQTAGNADWTLDEDTCGTAQRYPTPAQTQITSSTAETFWNGGFSAFGVDMVKKGFWVESLPVGVALTYGTSNAQDLANYNVLVLPEPNVRYTSAEITAIRSFVQNGGGLLMIADHANSDRNNDGWDSPEILNELMGTPSVFGVTFGANASDPNHWFNDNPDDKYTIDTNSPIIFTGTYGNPQPGRGLGLFGSTSMTLDTTANASVRGHVWKRSGTADTATLVTFATATYGTGRIAAIGDSSPAEDGTNNCGHTTYVGYNQTSFDNALIFSNAMSWISNGGGSSGGQLLGNPGFENGSGSPSPWSASSGIIDNSTSPAARSGSWKAWMNGYGATHTDTLTQTVSIPSSVTSATLTFYLRVTTEESGSTAYDTLKVQVRNSSGGVLATLATYSNANAGSSYVQKSFNLNAYKGQTVQIHLLGVEDYSLATSFLLDDFALTTQ